MPGDVLPVIATAYAVINVGKEGLARECTELMSPEGRDRNDEGEFPMRLVADDAEALASEGSPTVNLRKILFR